MVITVKLNTKTIIVAAIIVVLTIIAVHNCTTASKTQTASTVTPPQPVANQQVDDGLDMDSVIVGAVVGAVAGNLVSKPSLTNPPKQNSYKKPFRTEDNNYPKKKAVNPKPAKKANLTKSHKPAKKVNLTKSKSRRK